MAQVMARVLYVNYPEGGKRFGSIKLDHRDVRYVSVKPSELPQFEKGKVYTIDITTTDQGYHNLLRVVSSENKVTPPSAARTSSSSTASHTPQSHDYNTGKQIAVTGITQRAVQNGSFTIADIPQIMKAVAKGYDEIFGAPSVATRTAPAYSGRDSETAGPREDVPFDDEIPY